MAFTVRLWNLGSQSVALWISDMLIIMTENAIDPGPAPGGKYFS